MRATEDDYGISTSISHLPNFRSNKISLLSTHRYEENW